MRQFKFKIPIYDWTVKIMDDTSKDDYDKVHKYIMKLSGGDDELSNKIAKSMSTGYNGAHILTDNGRHIIYLFLTLHKSETEFVNTIFHEVYHIVDILCEACGVVDMESKAYIAGFTGSTLFDKFKKLAED